MSVIFWWQPLGQGPSQERSWCRALHVTPGSHLILSSQTLQASAGLPTSAPLSPTHPAQPDSWSSSHLFQTHSAGSMFSEGLWCTHSVRGSGGKGVTIPISAIRNASSGVFRGQSLTEILLSATHCFQCQGCKDKWPMTFLKCSLQHPGQKPFLTPHRYPVCYGLPPSEFHLLLRLDSKSSQLYFSPSLHAHAPFHSGE